MCAGSLTSTCPWRIRNLGRYRKVKQTTTVLLPSVIVDMDHLFALWAYGCSAIPARMSPALVEVALIFTQLVLQVRRSPEECVVE